MTPISLMIHSDDTQQSYHDSIGTLRPKCLTVTNSTQQRI